MDIYIIFENQDYLIINKPSGLVVHGDGKTDEPSVVSWLQENRPEINRVGEAMVITGKRGREIEIPRPGIVHRIDRDTSGCLVIAKNQASFEYLKDQFKNLKVDKTYQALVYGSMKNDSGIIDAPIGKSRRDFRMKSAGPHARGLLREAVTEYTVVSRYEDPKRNDNQNQNLKYTLVELSPKTGRTHQIRVHLKHLNYPIVSDSLYAGKRKPVLGISRTALHAHSISFHDSTGELITATCELASDMKEALLKIKQI
jgi:23S rRNA pseudouridine1911/1915/1917 synthase